MLEILGIQFHLYGLIIALAIWVGYVLAKKILTTQKIAIDFDQLVLVAGTLGIIGARLYHVITDWHLYSSRPIEAVYIWQGGLGVIGAIIGGVTGVWLSLKIQKKTQYFLPTVESLLLVTPLSQAIGRWGNYFNRELYGLPNIPPGGIFIPRQNRPPQFIDQEYFHPLFLYESILNGILFCLLFIGYQKKWWRPGQRKILAIYLIGYSLIRFSLEFLRIETARFSFVSFFSIAQWIMIGVFGLGIFLLYTNTTEKS